MVGPNFVFYRVVIDGAGFTGPAPGDGFIDNRSTAYYAGLEDEDGNVVGQWPSSYENALEKQRGNVRWRQIVSQLTENATPFFVGNFDYGGDPNWDTAPSTIAFTVGYDRPDYLYTDNREGDPEDVAMFYDEDALRRQIVRGLMARDQRNMSFYDPRNAGGSIERIEMGPLTEDLAAAEGAVTVERIELE